MQISDIFHSITKKTVTLESSVKTQEPFWEQGCKYELF